MSFVPRDKDQIAARCARDLPGGASVNLGVGVPLAVARFIDPGRDILLHSENGMLGMGPLAAAGEEDADIVNAGRQFVTLRPGASIFSHSDSFAMIRGGHLDYALLGAFQVSAAGDLANWATDQPGAAPALGGAMDLATGARQVWVLMDHTTRTGAPRILQHCSYPLTAPRCVRRIYTSLAVIEVTGDGLLVTDMIDGLDFATLQAATGARLHRAGSSIYANSEK